MIATQIIPFFFQPTTTRSTDFVYLRRSGIDRLHIRRDRPALSPGGLDLYVRPVVVDGVDLAVDDEVGPALGEVDTLAARRTVGGRPRRRGGPPGVEVAGAVVQVRGRGDAVAAGRAVVAVVSGHRTLLGGVGSWNTGRYGWPGTTCRTTASCTRRSTSSARA